MKRIEPKKEKWIVRRYLADMPARLIAVHLQISPCAVYKKINNYKKVGTQVWQFANYLVLDSYLTVGHFLIRIIYFLGYCLIFGIPEESKKPVNVSKRLKFHWALARAFQAQFMPLAIGQWNFIVSIVTVKLDKLILMNFVEKLFSLGSSYRINDMIN